MKVYHREHALAYINHSFKTCGGPEAFTSTTISYKCGGKITDRQERNILKTHSELLYPLHLNSIANEYLTQTKNTYPSKMASLVITLYKT